MKNWYTGNFFIVAFIRWRFRKQYVKLTTDFKVSFITLQYRRSDQSQHSYLCRYDAL